MKGITRTLRSNVPTVVLLTALALRSLDAGAQAPVPVEDIEKQLLELYQTTKPTADGTDIVTAGAVLVLQKDHLLMDQVDQPIPTPNSYRDGRISQGGLAGAASLVKAMSHFNSLNPFANNSAATAATAAAGATREFVTGEKFWVSKIDTRPDGVTFSLISDPIKDQRYHATLHFPFARGAVISADDVASTVGEVLKIDAGDAAQQQGSAQPQGSAPAQAAAPAPAPETKTIALGQTRDQVIAAFGVPSKVVQLGPKEIDVFPDMKVTFVQNKVVDVK
jgi:hypothetical protein